MHRTSSARLVEVERVRLHGGLRVWVVGAPAVDVEGLDPGRTGRTGLGRRWSRLHGRGRASSLVPTEAKERRSSVGVGGRRAAKSGILARIFELAGRGILGEYSHRGAERPQN